MSTLKDLYFAQIKDLYDAEHQILEALPKIIEESSCGDLQAGLKKHFSETENQVRRLERIFSNHDMTPERETCKAMKGLVAEGDADLKEWKGECSVKDAAIIAACQRIEHYEMAGYGTARCYAEILGFAEDCELLDETFAEEKSADEALTDVALGSVNRDALLADDEKVSSNTKNKQKKSGSSEGQARM